MRIFPILKSDRYGKLKKMVGERKLALLQDDLNRTFQESYAASPSAAFYFFDRQGCLIPNEIHTKPKTEVAPEILRRFLSEIHS